MNVVGHCRVSAPAEPAGRQYCLGRRQVPIDVCRPRQTVVAPVQPTAPTIFVHRETTARHAEAVPQEIGRESETTRPLPIPTSRGPGHAELSTLAQTGRGPLTLAGRYRLDRCVGRGGMATVFRGEQLGLGRPVAVKILDGERGHRHDGLQRFMREARAIARLRHRSVVEVLDLGSTSEGVVYMVMELLDGEDLKLLLAREGRLPWALVREWMLEICAGLEATHAAGLVHRDLKPANCFRSAEGLKLLDFGIASVGREAGAAPADDARDEERLTVDGQVIGTPEYMSPEQARGEGVDARSDVYAAGILLGELLTGRVPFVGKSASSVIDAQIHEAPPSLAELGGGEVEIDPAVEAIFARALRKDPGERFADVAELRAAIEGVGATAQRRRWRPSWLSAETHRWTSSAPSC